MELYRDASKNTTGILMPIGGAEDRKTTRLILRCFVEFSGGTNARIVIVPTASNLLDTGAMYSHIFTDLGAQDVRVVNPTSRREANDPDFLAPLNDATGIFISGGDQVKLITLIGGTKLGLMIRERFASGAVVAGTSAGASAISEHMIAFGRSGAQPSQSMVSMGTGLGLAPHLVIDQHFRQRDRLGRLMTAITLCPERTGVGVDEDTALILRPDNTGEVIGSGTVTVVDSSMLEYSDLHAAKRHDPITVVGMRVYTLATGDQFDFTTHEVIPSDDAVAV